MIIEVVGDIKIVCTDDKLVEITIGDFSGHWAREQDTKQIANSEIALCDDKIYQVGGKYYHSSQFDEFEIVFDQHHEEYTFIDECHYGYIAYREQGYFSIYHDFIFYDDVYYINNGVAEDYGVYYCNDCDNYYHSDDGCNCNSNYCFEYHSGYRKDYSQNSIYKIGVEVEKEDESLREKSYAFDLFDETGWAKEEDSSLCSYSGFELISPVLPLDITMPIYEQPVITERLNDVSEYLNADYSDDCGGHINISVKNRSSGELLHDISGYLPLFYSMYSKRLNNTYSPAKSKQHYMNNHNRYSAFHCKHNGVLEIRIFPAVKNEMNLKWRLELLRIILANQTSSYRDVIFHITNVKHELHQHLLKVYSTNELLNKIKQFNKYAKKFDNVELSTKLINRGLTKLIKQGLQQAA